MRNRFSAKTALKDSYVKVGFQNTILKFMRFVSFCVSSFVLVTFLLIERCSMSIDSIFRSRNSNAISVRRPSDPKRVFNYTSWFIR